MSERGKVLKVISIDDDGERASEWSHQLPADPFGGSYRYAGLQEPPFSLEQLVFLAEQHPTHSATLEQKAADIVGTGWEWKSALEDGEPSDEGQRKKLESWFKELAEDGETDSTTHEILLAACLDLETVGQGLIELARDTQGRLRHWFHMPAHTCRFHRDGVRIAQVRNGKRVWFKRWIPEDEREVNRITGAVTEGRGSSKARANEIFVLKRPSRRSSWYGIPTYIPATGWITLSTAARDDNLLFFENRREPRWAVILENVEDDPEIEEQIRRALAVDLKRPHRNLILPLSGPAKVTFQKLGDNKGDMSWEKLQERADVTILTAHRMPGERIGIVRTGALGGNTVQQSGKVYKESFIQTSQSLLAARVNKLIAAESEVENPNWLWTPQELDISDRDEVQDNAVRGFQGGVSMLDEAREQAGLEPLEDNDDRGDKFLWELSPEAAAAASEAIMSPSPDGGVGPGQLQDATSKLAQEIQDMINGAPAPDLPEQDDANA